MLAKTRHSRTQRNTSCLRLDLSTNKPGQKQRGFQDILILRAILRGSFYLQPELVGDNLSNTIFADLAGNALDAGLCEKFSVQAGINSFHHIDTISWLWLATNELTPTLDNISNKTQQ